MWAGFMEIVEYQSNLLWLFIYEAHVLKRSRLWFHITRLRCITSKMRNIIEQIIIERYVGSKISEDFIVAMELFMKAKLYKESKQSIWEWDMVCCIYMVSNWLSLLVMRNVGRNGFHSWFKCDTSFDGALCDESMKSWNSGYCFEELSLEKDNWFVPRNQC